MTIHNPRIAGYGDEDGWHNLEGEEAEPYPTAEQLDNTYRTVIAFEDDYGVTHYRTIWGPIPDEEILDDLIDEVVSGSPAAE